MSEPLPEITELIEAIRTRQTFDNHVALVQRLTLIALEYIAHLERGINTAPFDRDDFMHAAGTLRSELNNDEIGEVESALRVMPLGLA